MSANCESEWICWWWWHCCRWLCFFFCCLRLSVLFVLSVCFKDCLQYELGKPASNSEQHGGREQVCWQACFTNTHQAWWWACDLKAVGSNPWIGKFAWKKLPWCGGAMWSGCSGTLATCSPPCHSSPGGWLSSFYFLTCLPSHTADL